MPDDGAGGHPWFVGLEGPGRFGLAWNITIGALVPVLTLADVMVNRVPAARAAGLVGIAVVVGAALACRLRWPLAVLLVALLAVVGSVFVEGVTGPLMAAGEIAVFTVACLRPRRVAAAATLVAAAVLFGVAVTDQTGPLARGPLATGTVTEPRVLIMLVWTALAFALGVAVRTQRAYVVALAERARRAEETREHEARVRVAEERVRIARELHDVVAHHIAVINVHAGLARRAAGRDPAVVDASLGHVQDAARTVLDELGAVLQVLRSNDTLDPATAPTPGLDRLDDLLATFAAAGLAVRTRTTGRRGDMDPICDLEAFRIIQEALTNASKHGAGPSAELSLAYSTGALTLAVSNPVTGDPGPVAGASPRGHGLIGMRERAAACGGSLTAQRDGQGMFRVDAVIPYHPSGATTSAPDVTGPSTRCRGLA